MKQEVEKAQIEYSQLDTEKTKKISDTQMDYSMKDLEIKIAKTTLDDLKNGENEQVKLIKNNIKQKQKQIETIMKKYDAYVLKANFDGVITKMNLQIGDTIGSTSSNSTIEERNVYIENPNNLEIQVDVDQSDITKLSVGMPVQIKLDALSDSAYTGVLAEIDTTAGDSGGGYGGGATNYKAKIVFVKKAEDVILGSMTATVTIVLQEVYGVLVVPNIAISKGVDGSFVMKVEKGKYKKVPIEL
jgi:HlyD family secretion protein